MIKINYTMINLDINKKIYDKLTAKQGDVKSRYLLFNLNINGAAIDLTNKNVRVYAIKPDGYEIFNDLVVSDPVRGTCILELTTQILAVCGTVKMELVITEGQKKLSSFEFELEVIKSLNRETSIVSTNEFTALIEGLAALSEYDKYKAMALAWDTFQKNGGGINGDINIQDIGSLKFAIQDRLASSYGTWSPVIYEGTNGNNPSSYNPKGSYWIKIGRMVIAHFRVEIPANIIPTAWKGAAMLLKWLPFPMNRDNIATAIITYYEGLTLPTDCIGVGMYRDASNDAFWLSRLNKYNTYGGLEWGTHAHTEAIISLQGTITYYTN